MEIHRWDRFLKLTVKDSKLMEDLTWSIVDHVSLLFVPLPKQGKPFVTLNITAQPFDTDRLMEKSPYCSHLIIFRLTFNVTGETSDKHGKKKKQQNISSPKFGFFILQVFILTNQPGPIYRLMKWQKT